MALNETNIFPIFPLKVAKAHNSSCAVSHEFYNLKFLIN